MIINSNIPALNTHRQMGINQNAMQNSMEKLSSGLRINKAGDDAAGLAISEKMRGQIRGLDQASRNASDGISLIQTAEGALNETHNILQRMRELSVQSSNDTNVGVDRAELQKEVDQLSQEISRISQTTEFNTQNLLGGDFEAKFHIGANEGQDIKLEISDMSAEALKVEGEAYTADLDTTNLSGIEVMNRDGVDVQINVVSGASGTAETTATINASGVAEVTLATNASGTVTATKEDLVAALESVSEDAGFSIIKNDAYTDTVAGATAVVQDYADTAVTLDADESAKIGVNVSTQEAASAAITSINDAIETVSAERSKLGGNQNRLEHTIANLDNSSENLSAAESRVRDVDMAKEMMEMTRANILSQASQSMLAQANQQPQSVLQLLG
ncbi:flagellin [Streptohalobacillus salinus]|uniref:Flagellin n=1 Tax=Streptohalobacillus salinus TaxID=621096 RepID=A0A2V3WDM6_9BACI|nr:flagellin [Streptohalobacillus salinus]PXW93016.1 flagellin [Streptohalobacillus salinus]